ncbi:MAG: 2,3-bisphosphoglycerate-independent phosphoglycerate mutase [Defluviicoccus sp.]|nr:2,3-bisphosphoglycerate-independent phosphoglycerate mutase [Defluviicoccus sp.]MDG4593234.1 2,3-bisphosphoglycerate-independent phosphoglycerate mutase [Defluviicoccus sp.]
MLKRLNNFEGIKGPVVVVVMDGVGITPNLVGNAVANAHAPTLKRLMQTYPNITLKAHGTAVGMPSDEDMGNSEVGHNALGSGQVFEQGAALVNQAIASGKLFAQPTWRKIVDNVRDKGSTLHFLGLFSDGNVHSHVNHLMAMIKRAKEEGIGRVRVHILLDGRDVPETSALDYVNPFEAFLAELRGPGFDAAIASGGGRMNITMDRYEANWSMVEKGWRIHVLGEGRQFASAAEAIETLRAETKAIDQDLPPFVIAKDGQPLGSVNHGDSVVFFNFRGDRAIEISRAFEDKVFDKFDRVRHPNVVYAGMLEYDGDLHIPSNFLVPPPDIQHTMGEYFCAEGLTQLAISETQKYGHVTYFWNGNRSGKFSDTLEDYVEIPSDIIPFEQRPWMKAAEITDEMIRRLETGKYRFARCNYANGDMVGHTGNYDAALIAVATVDLQLTRLLKVVDQLGGVALITADHGNADEMYEISKKTKKPDQNPDGSYKAKTAHTLNPVPFILYDNQTKGRLDLIRGNDYGLSNVAATVANLLGFEAPEMWDRSTLDIKG